MSRDPIQAGYASSEAAAAGKTPRLLVTMDDAARSLSVPIGTLKSWKNRGKLQVAGLSREGVQLYDLNAARQLAAATPRRKADKS